MVILDSTAKSLRGKLGGAHTTTAPVFTTAWLDTDGVTDLEGSTDGVFNGSTEVTLCAAPASGHRRIVKSISIYNADTVDATYRLYLLNSSDERTIDRRTLSTLTAKLYGMDEVYTVNQGTNTTDSPTFANVTDSGLTASRLVLSDASKKLVSNGALTTNYIPKAASSGASLADSILSDIGGSKLLVEGALSIGIQVAATSGDLGVARSSTSGLIWFGTDTNGYIFRGSGVLTINVKSGEIISMPAGSVMIGATSGGLHVGGASEPGDDNLLVDGSATITGLAGTGTRTVLADTYGVLSAPLSDERLKKNISTVRSEVAMAMLEDPKIHAVNFQWKDEAKGDAPELGFTYQQLEPHKVPGLTFFDNGFGGINYDKICCILWEQNRGLLERIKKLENKLAKLRILDHRKKKKA